MEHNNETNTAEETAYEIISKISFGGILDNRVTSKEAVEILKSALENHHKEMINSPQFGEFDSAIKNEMLHHKERWGDESHKPPHDFALVLNYISGKLINAIWEKDPVKFEHHLITIASVCGSAHKYFRDGNSEVSTYFKNK